MDPTPPRMIFRLLFFFLVLVLPAFGDGGFKSPQVLKAVPIPQQTAVMWHQDGKETLTIWNTVEAESQELAWVLPLPAAPEVIQETDAAALRMIRMLCAPAVITARSSGRGFLLSAIPIGLLMLLGVWLLWRKHRGDTFGAIGCLPWIVLVVVGFHAFHSQSRMMPGIRGFPIPSSEVMVLREQTAGSYDTTVISGTSAEAVNSWLTGHGFAAFEGSDRKVLEDYIARKWVLFCARISTGGNGVKETHPLTVRFPVAQPVYPMRLTESAGTVPVDLFFIGGSFARDSGGRLQRWSTLDFTKIRFLPLGSFANALSYQQMMRDDEKEGSTKPMLDPEDLPYVPAGRDVFLDTLMTGGTQVTHLKHIFKPGGDWSDIHLEPTTESAPPRKHFTLAGYLERILTWVGFVPALVLVLAGCLAQWVTECGKRPHRSWRITMAILLAAVWIGTALFAWKTVIIVPSENVISPRFNQAESAQGWFLSWMKKLSAAPAVTPSP